MRAPLALVAALVALAGTAYAADQIQHVAPVSAMYTNSKGDWIASVWRDPGTGCEYLIRGDSIIPRLGRDGRPRCE